VVVVVVDVVLHLPELGKEAPLERYLLIGRLPLRANKRSGDEDQGLVVM
jgi:hypothetical protein